MHVEHLSWLRGKGRGRKAYLFCIMGTAKKMVFSIEMVLRPTTEVEWKRAWRKEYAQDKKE